MPPSIESGPADGGRVESPPPPDGHDTPQDLGGNNDPVFDKKDFEQPNR
jgi:hypothetical protein